MTVAMPAACSLLLLLLLVAPTASKCIIKGVRWANWEQLMEEQAPDLVIDDHQLGSQAHTFDAFIFDLSVGRQPLSVVMDITNELVWARCGPRLRPTPTFLPDHFGSLAPVARCPSWVRNNSGSFGQIHYADRTCHPGDHGCAASCRYVEHIYGAGNTSGYLATDKFRFGNTKIRSMVFGCSHKATVPDGLNISRFFYFITLPDDPDNSKTFISRRRSWGGYAKAKGSHTPMLAARPNQNPYLYYINLTGLQVDGQLLTDIPAGTFDVRVNGSGGVFLSTTLPFTYLEAATYTILRRVLMIRAGSQGLAPVNAMAGHSLCFLAQHFSQLKLPKLALVFDGADATMQLKAHNYFFALRGGNGGSVLSSLLQTGRTMTYDINRHGGDQLTFAGAPAPVQVSLATLLLVWVILF
ncbi:hypothetical protein VPH35_131842 [Triticum aestivum]